jgi:hypothetical protein
MKVLYISNYRERTGWARAGRDYILSLDAAGVDLVPRPIFLGQSRCELPDRIKELESQSSQGCDIVIQHTLPNLYDYNGAMFNIALYATETSDFTMSGWADRINSLDAAVVINT